MQGAVLITPQGSPWARKRFKLIKSKVAVEASVPPAALPEEAFSQTCWESHLMTTDSSPIGEEPEEGQACARVSN